MSQDSVGLLARHGELMDSQALIAFFKFGSDRSFRRSAAKAALPVAVFRVPGRSGWFARTQDVTLWLTTAGQKAISRPRRASPYPFGPADGVRDPRFRDASGSSVRGAS